MSNEKTAFIVSLIGSAVVSWIDMIIIKSGSWLTSRSFPYMGVISPIICLFVIFILSKFKNLKFIHIPDDCKDKTTLTIILSGFVLSIYPCVILALNGVML